MIVVMNRWPARHAKPLPLASARLPAAAKLRGRMRRPTCIPDRITGSSPWASSVGLRLADAPRAGDMGGEVLGSGGEAHPARGGAGQIGREPGCEGGPGAAGDLRLQALDRELAELGPAGAGDGDRRRAGLALAGDRSGAGDGDLDLRLIDAFDLETAYAVDGDALDRRAGDADREPSGRAVPAAIIKGEPPLFHWQVPPPRGRALCPKLPRRPPLPG